MALRSLDLMIGDLVTWKDDGECYRISEISEEIKGEATVCFVGHNYMVPLDEINPIPLTPEILEKNGFVWDNLPMEQYWEQYGLKIYPAGGGYRMNCGQNVSFNIDSVHELQHLLKLCGIEKEIEL